MGKDVVDQHIGNRIRDRRIEIELSLEAFAALLEVSVHALVEWETGLSRVGSDRLMAMTDILDVPPNFFFLDFGRDAIH